MPKIVEINDNKKNDQYNEELGNGDQQRGEGDNDDVSQLEKNS